MSHILAQLTGSWTAKDIPDLSSTRVLVTGANTGLGYASVLHMAGKGAEIIMTARSQAKGDKAMSSILELIPDAKLTLMLLDLSSLSSVRSFAKEFKQKYQSLDVLMNNAGTSGPDSKKHEKTVDGIEMTWQANFFAPFLLTNLLFECLVEGATVEKPGRVVMISSVTHHAKKNKFDPKDPEAANLARKRYYCYPLTKLADLMFANALHDKLLASPSLKGKILSLCAHPGFSKTDMTVGFGMFASTLFGMPAADGSLSQVRCAVDPAVQSGDFFGPNTPWPSLQHLFGPCVIQSNELHGYPTLASRSEYSNDLEVSYGLWERAEELTGEKFEIPN